MPALTPPPAHGPPRSLLRSPRRPLDLGDLRAMCLVSGGASLAFGLLFLGTVVKFLASGDWPDDLASGAAAGVFLTAKSAIELSAVRRLGKVERVALTELAFAEGYLRFARGWLLSAWVVLVLGAVHLAWAVVLFVALMLGLLVLFAVLVATLGTKLKEASEKVFGLFEWLATPFDLEWRALTFLWGHALGVLLLALVVGAFTLGPTITAVVLHRKAAALRARGATRAG